MISFQHAQIIHAQTMGWEERRWSDQTKLEICSHFVYIFVDDEKTAMKLVILILLFPFSYHRRKSGGVIDLCLVIIDPIIVFLLVFSLSMNNGSVSKHNQGILQDETLLFLGFDENLRKFRDRHFLWNKKIFSTLFLHKKFFMWLKINFPLALKICQCFKISFWEKSLLFLSLSSRWFREDIHFLFLFCSLS